LRSTGTALIDWNSSMSFHVTDTRFGLPALPRAFTFCGFIGTVSPGGSATRRSATLTVGCGKEVQQGIALIGRKSLFPIGNSQTRMRFVFSTLLEYTLKFDGGKEWRVGLRPEQEAPAYAAFARVAGGAGDTTVIASPERLSLLGASLLNGYLITTVTVCDTYLPGHVHISPEVIPPALAVAEAGRKAAGLSHVEFREAPVEALPLADASFDVALCNGLFSLVPDKPAALREIFRVLRPGGRLQVCDMGLTDDALIPENAPWSD